jgi:RNA polymerase sigma-70 factor, ECF subfamily
MKYVREIDEAKGIVQEVFVTLWEKYPTLPADTNFRSYLFTSVKNRCLNHIRDRKKITSMDAVAENAFFSASDDLQTQDLESEIEIALNTMPPKCREAFELSRTQGLKYAAIAEQMGISVKTVEAHMTKALGILRDHLARFLSMVFILFYFLFR